MVSHGTANSSFAEREKKTQTHWIRNASICALGMAIWYVIILLTLTLHFLFFSTLLICVPQIFCCCFFAVSLIYCNMCVLFHNSLSADCVWLSSFYTTTSQLKTETKQQSIKTRRIKRESKRQGERRQQKKNLEKHVSTSSQCGFGALEGKS